MSFANFVKRPLGMLALGAFGAAALATLAYAADAPPAPPPPVPNKGDTAWMLISTALVLMMSIPGLPFSTAAWCAPRTCCPC